MTLALELSFDPVSEQRIHQIWVKLSRLYPGPGLLEIGGKPHLSLAVFRQGEPADIDRVVSELGGRLASFALNFLTVGAFRTDEGVVFLAPEDSHELRAAHQHMTELLGAESALIHAHYRPAQWLPHCTVAFNVPRATLDKIIEACQPHAPLVATVRRLSAVRYTPANTVCSVELA
jgi:2'-5' RNA ligase